MYLLLLTKYSIPRFCRVYRRTLLAVDIVLLVRSVWAPLYWLGTHSLEVFSSSHNIYHSDFPCFSAICRSGVSKLSRTVSTWKFWEPLKWISIQVFMLVESVRCFTLSRFPCFLENIKTGGHRSFADFSVECNVYRVCSLSSGLLSLLIFETMQTKFAEY